METKISSVVAIDIIRFSSKVLVDAVAQSIFDRDAPSFGRHAARELVQTPNHIAVAAWWPRIAAWFFDGFVAPVALSGLLRNGCPASPKYACKVLILYSVCSRPKSPNPQGP